MVTLDDAIRRGHPVTGETPMFPIKVDPRWYDTYWNSDRPQLKRRPLAGSVVRFAVLVGLLAGSGAALSYLQYHRAAGSAQDWEQE
jgi:hypothetical protein